ncbi:MAG: GDP-mannose 4,6-dehydratase [Candidatus Sumerlaeia bacterium]|nr:GDP-mannose 4,6-dehydratase [Candidatus Sumerlaeia bacterium]
MSTNFPYKRVLITGGAGFIGSHLAERLLSLGCEVEALDDLSTGSVHNVEHLLDNPAFELTVASVVEKRDLAISVDRADAVCHLAAAVGVRLIVENPVRTIETNVSGTENVLQFARKKGKPVLLASTSEVYGKLAVIPFSEDDDVVLGASRRPRWAYACSKLLDEFLALAHFRENNLPVVIARLFNTVGPRQTGTYGMVIPRFVSQALAGEPLTVYGDGTQSRTFCHVADAVDGLVGLLAAPDTRGRVYNVGGEGEITMSELARLVIEVTGSTSEIVLVPFEQAYDEDFEDMQRRVPCLNKVNGAIGYQPKKDIRTIIDDVLAWERTRK